MALTMRQRKAIKRFIVHLASGTPADGGPLACGLTIGEGLRILLIVSAAGGGT